MSSPAAKIQLPSGQRVVQELLRGWTVLVFLFLYAPIAVLVAYSFNASRLNVIWTGFTFQWYGQLASNAPLLRATQNSLVIATLTTVLSIILGTTGAWLLHRYRFRGARAIQTLLTVPMVMPEVLMGISLLVFFATAGLALGFATVIIGHVTFCFPFVLVAVQARLQGLDPSLEEAALDLGATPAAAFRRVVLPVVAPAIASAALLSFMLSFDELVVTWFTASASSRTLPIEIYGRIRRGLDPGLNAISTVLVAATLAVVALAGLVRRRSGGSR